MNYSPGGLYMWDAWYMPRGGQVHVYHLQRRRPGAQVIDEVHNSLGHAVSINLVDWEECPPAFGPNSTSQLDDHQPWTGCAVWHQERGYLFYTMRGSANDCRLQMIGLATTTNPDRWQRHPGNPVIVPDPHWYATPFEPVPGVVDCRDLVVVPDPANRGWFGFYATRQPAAELPQTSVIACVHSPDLIHWEHRSPAFAPGKYACIEVPDVFPLAGRWYLTCLTGNWYGNRGIWSDPNLTNGTIFAVSDRPEGPYAELSDNALLASRTTGPISVRSVFHEGERYILYTDRERTDHTDAGEITFGTLATPKVLRTDGDRLLAAYSPRIEVGVSRELIGSGFPSQLCGNSVWGQLRQMPTVRWSWGETVLGEGTTGWGVAPLGHRADSFIFESTVTLEAGVAAGLALRMDGPRSGAIVALDMQEQSVFYAEVPNFDIIERRLTLIRHGEPIRMRVVNRLEHVEIYVNDELRLAFSRYRGIGGEVGIFVDRGRARFADVRLRELRVTRPE